MTQIGFEKITYSKVVGLLLLLLLLATNGFAGENESIKLPMLASFIPAIGEDGKPKYVTDNEIEKMIRKHSPQLRKFYHNRKITNFIVPEQKWFDNMLSGYLFFIKHVGLKGEADTWDCENYSSTLNALATLKVWKAGYFDTRAAIGWLRVNPKHSWAGIPAGKTHALMFAVTNKGFYIFEPQNGKYAHIADYPNNEFVEEVYLF